MITVMNTAIYTITSFAPYYYNVHILTNGVYCGIGKFCTDKQEMIDFCKSYNVTELRKGA